MRPKEHVRTCLYRIPTSLLVIDDSCHQPTYWDAGAVDGDLRHFVSVSRKVCRTPEVRSKDGDVVVINGAVFVLAARMAVPPIEEIVCASSDPRLQVDSRIVKADVSELLENENSQGDVLQVLYFSNQLSPEQIDWACSVIEECLQDWPSPKLQRVGHELLEGRSIILWNMPISSFEDIRSRKLTSELRQSICKILPVSSWNGIKMQ